MCNWKRGREGQNMKGLFDIAKIRFINFIQIFITFKRTCAILRILKVIVIKIVIFQFQLPQSADRNRSLLAKLMKLILDLWKPITTLWKNVHIML